MNRIQHYFKTQPLIKKLSDLSFLLAIAVSGFTLVRTYLSQRDLPTGVCPITTYNNWYIFSIVLLILSFALSILEKKKSS